MHAMIAILHGAAILTGHVVERNIIYKIYNSEIYIIYMCSLRPYSMKPKKFDGIRRNVMYIGVYSGAPNRAHIHADFIALPTFEVNLA
jgi:hypothetical protein